MFDWLKRPAARPVTTPTAPDLLAVADRAREAGDATAAGANYLAALERDPASVYARYWLATLAQEAGDVAAAREHAERGLALDPDQIGMLLRLGSIAMQASDPMRSLACYERVFALDASAPGIDLLLANQYTFLGRIDNALAALDRALDREPDSLLLQSYRLFVLNYAEGMSAEQLAEEHRNWGRRQEARFAGERRPHPPGRDPERKLRIGYVSPDLREHAVAFFVEPLLANHDRRLFEVTCFDVSPLPEDTYTARLRKHAHEWRRVGKVEDGPLAEMVRAQAIDILIDLTGHLQYHRLLLFARRAAPVQATWLGYLNTTGLPTMDYRITDAYLDPPGWTERLHTEQLVRLPNHACFAPPAGSPDVGPLPVERTGRLTFASANQWSKVTPVVRDAWARILAALPDARLLVVARGGQNAAFRDWIVGEFASRGAHPSQIVVEPTRPLRAFQELLGSVDITLDPFPYGGGTTTLHSLWMGAPVVTLAGRTAFSRNSIGPLTEAGLPELVTATSDAYVETAVLLARDQARLAGIRAGLRGRLRSSALLDAPQFAANMEAAYRAMWRSYCEGAKPQVRVE